LSEEGGKQTMIRKCFASDFERIYEIIDDAAHAYKMVIPAESWKEELTGVMGIDAMNPCIFHTSTAKKHIWMPLKFIRLIENYYLLYAFDWIYLLHSLHSLYLIEYISIDE
jgi:hypothetical protein